MSKKVTPSDAAAVSDHINELSVPGETDTPQVRIGAGSVLTLVSQMVGLGTSFLIGIMVARTLGPVGKGQLYAIMQVPGILIVALDFGITTSNIYFISRGELRPGTAAANSALIAAAFGVLAAPFIYLLLSGPLAVVPGVPALAIVFALVILPAGLFAAWLQGISMGTGNMALPLWYSLASSCTSLAGLSVLFALHRATVGSVVAMSAAGTLVGICVFVLGLRKLLRPLRPDASAVRSATRFSARVYLSDIAGMLHNRQDVLVLGWLAGAGAVGLYSVGTSFAELTWFIPSALGAAIIAKSGRTSEVSGVDYVTRTTRVAIVFMAVTVLGSSLVVPPLIPFLYKAAFAPAVYAFFALLPGVVVDGVTRVLWNYQTARGRLYWRQSIASTVLNLAAVLALVPLLGPVGAGLASTISYTAIGIFVVWRFCQDTGARVSDVLVPTTQDVHVIIRTLRRLATGDATVD